MMQRDMREFMAALAAGIALGAVAASAVRPSPVTRRDRIVREIRRRQRRIHRDLSRTGHGLGESLAGTIDIGRAIGETGRDLAGEVKSEALGAVATAWERFAGSLTRHLYAAAGRRTPRAGPRRR